MSNILNNGEIDCAAKDVDKVKEVLTNYGLIQEYETPWIKDGNAEFSVSDLWGDIEDSLNDACKELKDAGIMVSGSVSVIDNDYGEEERLDINNSEVTWVDAQTVAAEGLSDDAMIAELEKRGYSIKKDGKTVLSAIPTSELVTEIRHRIDNGDDKYVAMKIWNIDDVLGVIAENPGCNISVGDVCNTGMLDDLNDCTDHDWEIIQQAVDEAVRRETSEKENQ